MKSASMGLARRCVLVFAGLLGACGTLTDSLGEQGRLSFSLAADYEIEESQLSAATLVAGHRQHLGVGLTSKGGDDISEPDEISYRLTPRAGTSIAAVQGSTEDAPDIDLLVNTPGNYELEAIYKGKVVDSVSLSFDVPDALDISVQTRAPYETSFKPVTDDGVISVVEGTQATFLPIPKKGKLRLLGRIQTEVSASPKKLVVPGEGASLVTEKSAWSAEGNIDFYFIDPGSVTITILDNVSQASGEFTFAVSATN